MRALCLLVAALALTGCSIASLVLDVKTHCGSDAACPPGEPACVAGVCVINDDRNPADEGEVVGEGEGEFVGDGEGEALCSRSDQIRCGGVCVTANTDEHCGGCDPCVDDGQACNGAESCVEGACKGESLCGTQGCNEPGICATCGQTSPCTDDRVFCNGTEVCVEGGCQSSGSPCLGQLCDEFNERCVDCLSDDDCRTGVCFDGTCVACNVDADCGGGFCDGQFCSEHLCAGRNACPIGDTCDEANDACIPACVVDDDCNNGVFCDGQAACLDGSCVPRTLLCPGNEVCDELGEGCSVNGLCTSLKETFDGPALDPRLIISGTNGATGSVVSGVFKVSLSTDANAAHFVDIAGVSAPFRVEMVTTVPTVAGQEVASVISNGLLGKALMVVSRTDVVARSIVAGVPASEATVPVPIRPPPSVRLILEVVGPEAGGTRIRWLADTGDGETLMLSTVMFGFHGSLNPQFTVKNITVTNAPSDVDIDEIVVRTACP